MTTEQEPRTEAGRLLDAMHRLYRLAGHESDILAIEAEVLEDVAERVRGLPETDPPAETVTFLAGHRAGWNAHRAVVLALLSDEGSGK